MNNKAMNLRKLNLALVLLGLISMFACKREEIFTAQKEFTMKKFFAENQTKSEHFTVDAASYSSVIGKKGTVITILPNILQHQDGSPVTGNVKIELKEVFDKGDMVKSNIPTMSNGRLLISQGEFYINATQNGESLKIKPGNQIDIYVPNFTNENSTMVFRGDSIPNDSTPDPTDSIIVWQPLDSTVIPPIFNDTSFDSIIDSSGGYFYFPLEGFGWINFDNFYDNNDYTNFEIETTGGFDQSNCNVFVVFRDIHSVMSAYYNQSAFVGANIPVGLQVTIVAIGKKDDQYYSSFKDITITPNGNITIDLNPTTLNAINQALENL
ncbi:MAG: hypothetical protein K1X55_00840 [Chitinophagales bacterium]|nr:hypothetical protein [Chitinophagales bacterium]